MKRIVKLHLQEELVDEFIQTYMKYRLLIAASPGCHSVTLLRDKADSDLVFTYSHWEDEQALNSYRDSKLFKEVWATVKPMFASRAEAWSVDEVMGS